MPADFHARWTEQIRKEQQTHPRRERRRQLHYILSAAALFVFQMAVNWYDFPVNLLPLVATMNYLVFFGAELSLFLYRWTSDLWGAA